MYIYIYIYMEWVIIIYICIYIYIYIYPSPVDYIYDGMILSWVMDKPRRPDSWDIKWSSGWLMVLKCGTGNGGFQLVIGLPLFIIQILVG